MEINAAMVKELRERTGAGMMQCKKALADAGGDLEAALQALRRMGLAAVAKRADRSAAEGKVEAYIHPGSRIGSIVEINCETDFVARTDDFGNLCREIAMQVAATSPLYLSVEDVPAEVVEEARKSALARISEEGAKGPEADARVEKEVDTYLQEIVLLKQPHIRDAKTTVEDLVLQTSSKLGEKISVRRFSCFRLGGA